jgi:hypothetical protein
MRYCILYSGYPIDANKLKIFYENHYKYILSNYNNVDIYYHTYDNPRCQNYPKLFTNIFRPKGIFVENFDIVKKTFLNDLLSKIRLTTTDTTPIKSLSMFYKIYKSFEMIKDQRYDIVIRNRVDITYNQDLVLNDNNYLNVPAGGDYHKGLMDLFAYGSFETMEKYSSLFLNLENYFLDDRFIFHPESALRYHCIKLNIPIQRFDYNIFLRGQNFTRSAPCYM